jgi:hypothetical protein
MAKTPEQIEMKVKPYVRIGDEWVPLTDLTPEQTAVLQAAYAKAVPPDFEEMVARAWDMGFAAGHDAGVLDEARPTNPFREGTPL